MNENERLRTVVKANDGFYLITTRPVRIGGFETIVQECNQFGYVFQRWNAPLLEMKRYLMEKVAIKGHKQICHLWADK